MNRIARILFIPPLPALLLFFSLVETPSFAQEPPHQPTQMTLWQARRTLTTSPKNENVAGGYYPPIRFSPDSFEYDYLYESKGKALSETIRVDLLTAPVVKVKCGNYCKITDEAGRSNPSNINPGLGRFLVNLQWSDASQVSCKSADCKHAAESFAAAFNVLRAFAMDPNAPLRTFTQRAAAWRALATKPPIPEEVNVQRLMAEDAIKENKPDEALSYFENGIELYPTWPEGNFNAALIAGDLGYYADAIEHMQAYLELVPNAADAQAAHEKILIWQFKSKQ
jgi:hypothetical protein